MDLDDLYDEPAKPAARPSRFAPKGSKKLNQKTVNLSKKEDDSDVTAVPKAEPGASASLVAPVAMDVDAKPDTPKDELMEIQDTPKDKPMETTENEEEEDEVVREIDIYFNPSTDPNTKLYVMQYPLRPMWRPYELEDRCSEVRVKSESADVEIDLAVDPNSVNLDPDSRFEMTKQTLKTSWKAPIHAGYAVGVLVGNRLHLNPVHAVVQLRPSMQHQKSENLKSRSSSTNNVNEDDSKGVGLKSERPTGPIKKQNLMQSKSAGSMNDPNEDAGENWVPLIYHGSKSDVSDTYVRKMVIQNGSPLNFSMSRDDYLNSICPGTSHGNNRSKGPLRRDLRSLPMEERFKTGLLEDPQIHRFVALKYLAPDTPDEDIFGVLKKYAQLVQGLWVAKSSLLYGTDHGVQVLARDFVLLLFSKSPFIKDIQLPKALKVNRAIKEVLSVLAIERPSLGDWKFKEPPDGTFVKCNPKIAAELARVWERSEKQITEAAFAGSNRPAANNSTTSKSLIKPLLKSSAEQKKQMSEEVCETIPKALKKLFQTHKVCSFNQICQGLRELAVSDHFRIKGSTTEFLTAAQAVDEHSVKELRAIISQFAIDVHGVYVPKSSPEYPQYDEFRKVVIELFLGHDPNAKLKKDHMVEAARVKLKREISSIEYQKVVQELCVSQNSAWVLRSGDGNRK